MAKFSRGKDAEDRLYTQLEQYGCTLMHNEAMDHKHKVDFVVLRFPEPPGLLAHPLAVQTTGKIDDNNKRATFFRQVQTNPYTKRNVYLELDPLLDLESGGAFIVMTALANFAFNQQYAAVDLIAIRVEKDLSFVLYEFERPVANVPQQRVSPPHPTPLNLRRPPEPESTEKAAGSVPQPEVPSPSPSHRIPIRQPLIKAPFKPIQNSSVLVPPSTSIPPRPSVSPMGPEGPITAAPSLAGVVVRYHSIKKIGTIESEGQQFFLHKDNVSDADLMEEIEALALDEEWLIPTIPVRFRNGGTLMGKKNPVALNIRRGP